MKVRLLIVALSLFIPAALGQGQAPAKSTYADLLVLVKAGDRGVDFKQLRLAYADSHRIPDLADQKKAMKTAYTSKDYATVLADADKILAEDYVDIDAHYAEYLVQKELKHEDQADFERFVCSGLVDSIVHSGDGKSAATAWQVIDVSEEYALLGFLKLKRLNLTTSKEDGHLYDILDTVNPQSNERFTMYFNIDISTKREQQPASAK